MKKIFGGINLTWKKLILFAIITGLYTAIMALIPITKETSFRDIAIYFEWWILFGIIIICNSKTPLDSALKCFVFFLISQPLIYLIQVPFSHMGWKLFYYYKYWFIWTIACFPMGYVGYYIKKNNILSVLILLPMLLLLAYLGLGYLSAVVENFPHHLLSFIFCFTLIIVLIFNIFKNIKLRILAFLLLIIPIIGYGILSGGIVSSEFETYKSLDEYEFVGDIDVTFFSGTKKGYVSLIKSDNYSVRLNGRKYGKYSFEITDEEGNVYSFKYYYDKKRKTIILEKTN